MFAQNPIHSFFLEDTPPSPGEIKRALAGCDKKDAGRSLLSLIEMDRLSRFQFGLFVEVVEQLALPVTFRTKLLTLANNAALTPLSRQFAVVAMTTGRQMEPDLTLLGQVEPEILQGASDMPLVDILTAIQVDPSAATDLKDVLMAAPTDAREFMLLQHVGRVRRDVGTPAAIAYGDALAENGLESLHDHMLDAVVNEGGQEGIHLLERLRNTASTDVARRRYQRALLRMGTRNIEQLSTPNPLEGHAYVSICDGQSAYFIFCRVRPSDADRNISMNCCIRASGEIRDAFILPNQNEQEFAGMLEDIRENETLDIVQIPLGQAATLFSEALERTRTMERKIPDMARPVISLFERVEATPLQGPEPPNGPREPLDDLMSRPHHDSWFFDTGDLAGYGISRGGEEALQKEEWLKSAAKKLSTPAIKERLQAMLIHMVRWYTWHGDHAAAQTLIEEQEELLRDFESSPLVQIMLNASLCHDEMAWTSELMEEESVISDLGNESLRAFIRRRFYLELKRPTGRHLAELDVTEVVYLTLQNGFETLPAEKRPSEETLLTLSHKLSEKAVSALLKGTTIPSKRRDFIKEIRVKTELSQEEAGALFDRFSSDVQAFVNDICADCFEACFAHPRKGKASPFFSRVHPAFEV